MWVDSEKIEGVRLAQFQSFATKMPAYYVTLAAMMAVTAYSFHGAAPRWLALGIPACFFIVSLVAGYWWWWHRTFVPKESKAHQYLTLATIALVVTVAAIVWMDISLFGWGNSHQRYFIIVHLVFVAVSGFFCLMHLQLAAATVAIIVGAPVIWLSCSMDQPSDHAIALDAVAMVVLMIFTMVRYQSDFIHLVRSRGETQRLSQENVRLANIDTLTGLQNRRQFFAALQLQSRPPWALSISTASNQLTTPMGTALATQYSLRSLRDSYMLRARSRTYVESAATSLPSSSQGRGTKPSYWSLANT